MFEKKICLRDILSKLKLSNAVTPCIKILFEIFRSNNTILTYDNLYDALLLKTSHISQKTALTLN